MRREALSAHCPATPVTEARERGWATLVNGKLLIAAEEAGFDLMVTSDKNIRYQQSLGRRTLALVILTQYTEVFRPFD